MPEVSVLIPIYNTEEYLPACLESILAQTEKNIEIIAVNNGSTDNCINILEEYAKKDRRIRVISKSHGDIYTARNAGIDAAIGEWVVFCDSDDTIPPRAYERMLRKAQKTCCDVVVGSHIELDSKGEKLPRLLTSKKQDDFDKIMSMPCVWNKMIRRSFLMEKDLRFPSVPIEDVIFLAKLLKCAPHIESIKYPVYYYWQHSSGKTVSITYQYTIDVFKGLIQSHRMVYEELMNTAFCSRAEEYVSSKLSFGLKEFLPCIWESSDRKQCFKLFRDHILSFNWSGREEQFNQIFEVPISYFKETSAEMYIKQIMALNHRRAVLAEYRAGIIGFQYIYAYFLAWIQYKIKLFMHKEE